MINFIIVNPSTSDGLLHVNVDRITVIHHYTDNCGTNCTIHACGDWFPVKENAKEVLKMIQEIQDKTTEASERRG